MQDIIAISIALACVAYAVRAARRQFSGTSGCGSGRKSCGQVDPSRAVKRTPLVTMGLPNDKSREKVTAQR